MELYFHPTSPYSRKAWVGALLLGAPVTPVVVDVMGGGLQDPAFLARSPFGKLPVLVAPSGPIIESTSILEHLDAQLGPKLLPPEVALEARRWDRIGDLYLIDSQSIMLFQPGTPAAEAAERAATTAWGLLEAQLDGRPFVCGAAFTLGDLSGAIGTDYLMLMDVAPPPRVRAWRDRCFAIPELATTRAEAMPLMERFLARRRAALAGG